jgi:cytochrome c oxidase subunit 2
MMRFLCQPRRALLAGLVVGAAVGLLVACGGAAKPSAAAALVARGRQLYVADGCESCHSLNGAASTGPTWKRLYASRVLLSSGRTIFAGGAYLTRHIVDPNAMTVHGYPGSVMADAISGDHLAAKPADVRALVALIESVR